MTIHLDGNDSVKAAVYWALVESLDDNMDRVDGAYDHFSQAFTRALDEYVECAAAADREADGATDAVAFLEEQMESGTPHLTDWFERAATELQAELTVGSNG